MKKLDLKDKIEYVKADKITPYPNNAKAHPDEQVQDIAASIKEYGFTVPIILDADNTIIAGHGRMQAVKKLDIDEVPAIKRDDLTKAQAKALRLADNKIAESSWQDEKLAVELEQLTEEDSFEELIHGFDEDELSEYLDQLTDEEDLQEPETEDPEQIETDIQEGEVFKLGEHRLMCGDATNEEHVKALMDGSEMDLILTDPPYGIDVVADDGTLGGGDSEHSKEYRKIEGDETEFDVRFLFDYDCRKIIWGGNFFAHTLPKSTHWIVWDKRGSNMDGGSDAGTQSDCELAYTNIDRTSVKKYKHVWAGWFREGDRDVEGKTKKHPTQKPVGLQADILKDYTEKEINIVDLFAGSGSLLLAAEQTNRKAFCMELDPQYCQVIINRWEELTGKQHEVITT